MHLLPVLQLRTVDLLLSGVERLLLLLQGCAVVKRLLMQSAAVERLVLLRGAAVDWLLLLLVGVILYFLVESDSLS